MFMIMCAGIVFLLLIWMLCLPWLIRKIRAAQDIESSKTTYYRKG